MCCIVGMSRSYDNRPNDDDAFVRNGQRKAASIDRPLLSILGV